LHPRKPLEDAQNQESWPPNLDVSTTISWDEEGNGRFATPVVVGLPTLTAEASQEKEETSSKSIKEESRVTDFVLKVGERVVFRPDGGSVKLTGKVISVGEKTVTIRAGGKKIPVYKDKGRFEPARDPVTVNLAGKGGNGFER
jgi:hypothetical protein